MKSPLGRHFIAEWQKVSSILKFCACSTHFTLSRTREIQFGKNWKRDAHSAFEERYFSWSWWSKGKSFLKSSLQKIEGEFSYIKGRVGYFLCCHEIFSYPEDSSHRYHIYFLAHFLLSILFLSMPQQKWFWLFLSF